jgi:hypothetical protein
MKFKSHLLHAGIPSAVAGGVIGALKKKKVGPTTTKDRVKSGLIGSAIGGIAGTSLSMAARGLGKSMGDGIAEEATNRIHSDFGIPKAPPPPKPSAKATASKRWGVKEKDVIKEAMYASLTEELNKIAQRKREISLGKIKQANAGTILGGIAGYAIAPNTMKGKVIGTVAGGALGGGTVAGLRKAKQSLYDQPLQREREEISNYVPTVMQQRAASPYGPYSY